MQDKSTNNNPLSASSMHHKSEAYFEEMLSKSLPRIQKAALRYTKNPSQAEDLVQETLLRALCFKDSFVVDKNFSGWISKILLNTFLQNYRRKKRESQILEQCSIENNSLFMGSLPQNQAYHEKPDRHSRHLYPADLLAEINRLPKEYKEAILLCDIMGMSYKQACQIINCPIGTIMSRIHRGRQVLGQNIQNTEKKEASNRQHLTEKRQAIH